MRRSFYRGVLSVAVVALLLAGLLVGIAPRFVGADRPHEATRPNIVFVLADDLAWGLVPYMQQVRKLRSEGMTFDNYVVTDTLCCPSRASIFTGRFPHNTGIYTNNARDGGGFPYFHMRGQENDTFATTMQALGYRTGFMGKYLNGYEPDRSKDGDGRPYVPPGWTEWYGAGTAYGGYNYSLNENRTVVRYGHSPQDYLTDVLADKGEAFIKNSVRARKPFLLEVAPFAPHAPYHPAPRNEADFPGLTAPREPAFNTVPTNPPRWLANRATLSASERNNIDITFRRQAQSVQAIDDLIARLRVTLEKAGVANDTYVVFNSDNGFHLGEHGLKPGKQTAFDSDVRVPLVVAGPNVPAGSSNNAATANIDLAPTFGQLAGAPESPTVDGKSLVGLFHGGSGRGWRTANLVEHRGLTARPGDPDRPEPGGGNPPTYQALRTDTYTYVEYVDGSREYYDLKHDPWELHNIAGELDPIRLTQLHVALEKLATCRATVCWSAGHV